MRHLAVKLDKVASALESNGFKKLAAELDVVSNTLERTSFGDLSSLSGPFPFGGKSLSEQGLGGGSSERKGLDAYSKINQDMGLEGGLFRVVSFINHELVQDKESKSIESAYESMLVKDSVRANEALRFIVRVKKWLEGLDLSSMYPEQRNGVLDFESKKKEALSFIDSLYNDILQYIRTSPDKGESILLSNAHANDDLRKKKEERESSELFKRNMKVVDGLPTLPVKKPDHLSDLDTATIYSVYNGKSTSWYGHWQSLLVGLYKNGNPHTFYFKYYGSHRPGGDGATGDHMQDRKELKAHLEQEGFNVEEKVHELDASSMDISKDVLGHRVMRHASMRHLTTTLDKVANELESRGLEKLATELDEISNTLEVNAGAPNKYLGDPKKVVEDLKNKLNNSTFVFFDTETTGLNAGEHQIVEIAAIAVKGDRFQIVDKFHGKAALSDRTKQKIEDEKKLREKHNADPNNKRKFFGVEECLVFNKYEDVDLPAQEEKKLLQSFKEFVEKQTDPFLVAQNAEFDMKFVGSVVGAPKNKGVKDTMMMSRMLFIPALQALKAEGNEDAAKILAAMTSGDKVSSRLGDVLKGLGVEIVGWHSALADVQSTIALFRGITDFIEEHELKGDHAVYKDEQTKAIMRQRGFKLQGKGPR